MHAGKQWPRQPKNFIQAYFPNSGYGGPVRKLKLVCASSGFTGSVALLWQGTTTISSVADYWAGDTTWIFYTFINDADPLATIDVRGQYFERRFSPASIVERLYRVWYEPRYDGDLLADRETEINDNHWWTNPAADMGVGPSWLHKTDVLKWNTGTLWAGAANWADQPEYHPYRH